MENSLKQLVAMGFNAEEAAAALTATQGNAINAVDLLLKGHKTDTKAQKLFANAVKLSKNAFSSVYSSLTKPTYASDVSDGELSDLEASIKQPIYKSEKSPIRNNQNINSIKNNQNINSIKTDPVHLVDAPLIDFSTESQPAHVRAHTDTPKKTNKKLSDDLLISFDSEPIPSQPIKPSPLVSLGEFDVFSNLPQPPKSKSAEPDFSIFQVKKPVEKDVPTAFKEEGNRLFKGGQYADAAAVYSQGLSVSGAKTLLTLQLYNNRAAALLKTGDYKTVIEDCEKAIELASILNISDDLPKSYLRRGSAYEALEKWEKARDDYRQVLTLEPNSKPASDGLARCHRCLSKEGPLTPNASKYNSSNTSKYTSPNPKPSNPLDDLSLLFDPLSLQPPKPQTSNSSSPQITRAVNNAIHQLRAQTKEQEDEENAKLELKDEIDTQLLEWSKGKESNLRALISSLDSILWKELQWQKVEMSELVLPNQVKIKYMKAVAKVHPDKVQANATLEQKMIANGVFTILNQAWEAFKS